MKTKIYRLCCAALLAGCSFAADAQTITAFAGMNSSPAGYAGDGGPANNAQLNHPRSAAMDDTGNVYIVDAYNNVIRKVNPAGTISTFSGAPAGGFGGDGGDATFAQYDHPNYIAIDGVNNIYICDPSNARIRKIDHVTNIITTIVGDGTPGYIGDGGPATAAEINFPTAIALDAAGNLYIADASNNVIRKVNTSGIISTIAGNVGMGSYSGEGGPATAANIDFPYGLAFDHSGNLYFSAYYDSRICKIDAVTGIITTFAGVGGGSGLGSGGDGGPATAATFDSPWGIAFDGPGNMYIADNGNNRVRMVNTSGIVSRFAGGGGTGILGDGGLATAAQMQYPQGVYAGPDGSVYIEDNLTPTVRRVSGTLTHPPLFSGGHRQTLSACENASAISVNALLAVTDADAGQTLTWSAALSPLHGTIVVTYAAPSTGSTVTPIGLTYTPAASYVGTDSFRVRITDGTASDTTTVVVTTASCFVNHPPAFVTGHTQTLNVCKDAAATSINALMSVTDVDVSQTETWSVIGVPAHGALAASYTTTSTGSMLTTTGLTYTPAPGYVGTDMFKVRIFDGFDADTTIVNVTIPDCSVGVGNVTNDNNTIQVFPNPNPGTFSFNLSSGIEENVNIVITNMLGEVVEKISTTTNHAEEIQLNKPTGLYFLNATTAHGKWSVKISVVR